jgi:hypothetical protein
MQIDRSRFLFLTSALAATTAVSLSAGVGGCSKSDSTTDGGAVAETDASGVDASTSDSSVADAATADAADATACLGDDGLAPTCDPTDGGTQCTLQCQSVGTYLKHQVAQKAAECIEANINVFPTCEGGSPACVVAATAAACDDPTADTFCTTFAPTCADAGVGPDGGVLSQADCVAFVKGLTGGGRARLTTIGCDAIDFIKLGQ